MAILHRSMGGEAEFGFLVGRPWDGAAASWFDSWANSASSARKLKTFQREHKSSTKDLQSVRQTLEKLQSVRIGTS
ncbi:MAG TPA: hypothetical protein VGM54_13260 [Chthoniobacter sp.]|jgi:hypothetical protein